jgi:menaquinone-dependent protoporphyrinogen IX oxidase
MNIGIMVFSRTGHTHTVATRLRDRLSADGHQVSLERLLIEGPDYRSATTAVLSAHPSIAPFDGVVLAGPVNGGRMSAAMNGYLGNVRTLAGKRMALLLTHFFIRRWGADQTIEQMTEVVASKGGTVSGSGSVRWPGPGRGRRIASAIDAVAECFPS